MMPGDATGPPVAPGATGAPATNEPRALRGPPGQERFQEERVPPISRGRSQKVFLVNAPSARAVYKEDRCQNDANDLVVKFSRPPIPLLALAGIVLERGFEPVILDCPGEGISFRQYTRALRVHSPAFVFVNASRQTLTEDLVALKRASQAGARTVVFGYLATVEARQLLEHRFVDYAVMHEPELTVRELLFGSDPARILGLGFKEGGRRVVINEKRPFIEDLDSLPFPPHRLLNHGRYRNPLDGKKFLVVQVSRGCPFSCKFCLSTFMNGRKFRTRSVENVIEEIRQAIEETGIRSFFFRADTFTASRKWVKEFCLRIVREGLDIEWYTNSRIDTLDLSLLPLMRRAGCTFLGIGIETAVPALQARLGKNLDLAQAKKVLSRVKAAGILSIVYFLMGTPFDTEATMWENVRLSKQLDATFVEFTPFQDFEGIALADGKGGCNVPPVPPGRIMDICRKGTIQFYGRPSKILELSKIIVRSILLDARNIFYQVKNVLMYGFRVFFR